MFVIDEYKIRIGDIILIRTNDRTCEFIRKNTGSNFSHALIYAGDNSCLESNAFGVQSQSLQHLIFDSLDDCTVLRAKNNQQFNQLFEKVNEARSRIGTSYASRKEVSTSSASQAAKEPNRQFCTRYVAQIYHEASIQIVPNSDYCSPKDFEDSSELVIVLDALRDALPSEIEIAFDPNPITDHQRDVIHTFFEKVRDLLLTDIQTFDQLDEYLLKNPGQGDQIGKLLVSVGYTEIGDLHKNKNPGLYDFSKFDRTPSFDKCMELIHREYVNINSFTIVAERYKYLYQKTDCTYFNELSKCYFRYVELCSERNVVWKKYLEENYY